MLSGPRIALLGGRRTDADALLWQAAVVAAGGTVSANELGYVSALIARLKAAGVWTLLDRLWLFASENATQALIDLVARASATAVNTPAFTASQGYAGNGTTSYVNTNFNLSTATNYTRNSAHWTIWRRTAATSATQQADGVLNAAATAGTFLRGSAPLAGAINNVTAGQVTFTGSDGTGCHTLVRAAAGAVASYLAGGATATGTDASTAPENLTFWIGGRNFDGGLNQPHDAQTLAVSLGGALTAAQELAKYTALNAYKTAVGA